MRPVLVLTQGDPAGVGPELLLKALAGGGASRRWTPVVVAEKSALEAHSRPADFDGVPLDQFVELHAPSREAIERLPRDRVALVQPEGADDRIVTPGSPLPKDAVAAVAALDRGTTLVRDGVGDALVTLPVSKDQIARHCLPEFRGHTDYLANAAGLSDYGRDYLMAFLTSDLQVALLSTHLSLRQAIDRIDSAGIEAALCCLDRHCGGRIAVAGLNPHAGEDGLLGDEEERLVRPAIEAARRLGVDAHGPFSADSLFSRARGGEFDWVLALYHDQGLIAVKTASFGVATNWTIGLPYLRTSVDHGTAYEIAGQGMARVEPLLAVVATTLEILSGELPKPAAA